MTLVGCLIIINQEFYKVKTLLNFVPKVYFLVTQSRYFVHIQYCQHQCINVSKTCYLFFWYVSTQLNKKLIPKIWNNSWQRLKKVLFKKDRDTCIRQTCKISQVMQNKIQWALLIYVLTFNYRKLWFSDIYIICWT